ncbi:alpha/beta fold hydrolase [Aequorivita marina]|uniref:alpha/beta fold hydrolase n=1 Tax=Aequorivita marina TaxID=3073654 RepID=UPI002874569A|nr:alpha/beta hydrolase [Aequorivita sp. S2608]MDS1297338.1 alpha/beta hydrolase [Aequorivita sp. S2608]
MTLSYKNNDVYYETFGKGPALVLLHGFLESSVMWKKLIPALSQNNLVITLDFPGHGKSDVIAEIHSMELMAEVVNELLEHLQIPSATLIGHSMGGYITMAFAELFPEKIERLILLNSTPAADSEERKENRNRALKVIESNKNAFISMAITNLFAEASHQKFAAEIAALKKEAYCFPLAGVKAAVKGMRDRKDRTEVLKNFEKAKYSVLSEKDPLLEIEGTKNRAEACNANVITIDGGHHSTYENHSAVLKTLEGILKP